MDDGHADPAGEAGHRAVVADRPGAVDQSEHGDQSGHRPGLRGADARASGAGARISRSPPATVYQVTQQRGAGAGLAEPAAADLWTFDGVSPGPTYVARYGQPILVRNINNLPSANGGFGLNSVSTHLHNGHTPSESDGFPCDFFAAGQYYDQYYPNVLAGFNSTHSPTQRRHQRGAEHALVPRPPRELHFAERLQGARRVLSALQLDTGDETTGFRLPSFPELRHPDGLRRPLLRRADRAAGLRHLQHRRHPRRQVPGQRRDPAGAARAARAATASAG